MLKGLAYIRFIKDLRSIVHVFAEEEIKGKGGLLFPFSLWGFQMENIFWMLNKWVGGDLLIIFLV